MNRLLLLALSFSGVNALSVRPSNSTECRVIPGDAAWPKASDWASLNNQVEGKLISNIPIGAVCHNTFVSSTLGTVNTYDAAKCNKLRAHWFEGETHMSHPSSPMQYSATNNSCNPFDTDPNSPCTIGNHVLYSINATKPSHIQAGIKFAKKHNIRLIIRNTGHDFLGKSTGPHSLAIWMHTFKSREFINKWNGPDGYKGKAIRLGAGVQGFEAYAFAQSKGVVILSGNCPTVGITGGYTQGGGIGPLSSIHGLAADQVLEYTVITAKGDLVTANSKSNTDLFWALRGGGAGTFGVVTSMTVKVFQDKRTSSALITVLDSGNNTDAIYSGVETFISVELPKLVDNGIYIIWVLQPAGFLIQVRIAHGKPKSELDAFLAPTVQIFSSLGLTPEYLSWDFPDFLTAYKTAPGGQLNVSDLMYGGRLIPRSVSTDPARVGALVAAIRHVGTRTPISGVAFNVSGSVSSPGDVAVNPLFRTTLFNLVLGVYMNYSDWQSNMDNMNLITQDYVRGIEQATPGGGAYLNEADVQQPNWQDAFYGSHWGRLSQIKKKYDPTAVFYSRTAVGSEQWEERLDGRLCKV
ncbi:FAD-binding protein [Podospora fimiseda]|uniref:FAD-binding protein n=1 Tax=Podospora fimiseda TaxID=252190 RepID=A0AAN7BMF8_9PEZI|nr:FAD-binding protein [Podospora fimiseda]